MLIGWPIVRTVLKSESFGKRGLAWVIAGLVPTNPARVSTGQNGLP